MNTLQRAHLEEISSTVQVGPCAALPVKAVQIGEGNFLRAFFSWMVNELNSKGLFNGRIALVQPRAGGKTGQIAAQDGMFTIVSRGLRDGEPLEQFSVCTAVNQCLDPYRNWQEFLDLAHNPELKLLVSNTTEAGLVYKPCDRPESTCPASFPAKVTALLHERFVSFAGAPDKGLVLLPCELSESNGQLLASFIQRHAADWQLGADFIRWFDEHCLCCNTLVDRIVPGFPEGEIEQLYSRLGVRDHFLCVAELYHSWVIEADTHQQKSIEDLLPFTRGGLNVSFTPDLAHSRALKVRYLNGLHTSSVLAGYLCGCETVRDCTEHPFVQRLLRQSAFREIPTVFDDDPALLHDYAATILERFANPWLDHRCLSIALNSVSKWAVRVLPTLEEYRLRTGSLPAALTFSLAALITFYTPQREQDGIWYGLRGDTAYPLHDEPAVIDHFLELRGQTATEQVKRTLARADFWGHDLNNLPGLTDLVTTQLATIMTRGIQSALESLLQEADA